MHQCFVRHPFLAVYIFWTAGIGSRSLYAEANVESQRVVDSQGASEGDGIPTEKNVCEVGYESGTRDNEGICSDVLLVAWQIPDALASTFGAYPNLLNLTEWDRQTFHPVVKFPNDETVKVLDCSNAQGLASDDEIRNARRQSIKWTRLVKNLIPDRTPTPPGTWNIGKFDENRVGMYTSEHFQDISNSIDGYAGQRTVHLGIDLGGPVGTKVHAFTDGVVHSVGYNADLGDYGYVVVIEHTLPTNQTVWALYGHLDKSTLQRVRRPGKHIKKGHVVGRVGDVHENGGWRGPHVHFQLSVFAPRTHDMPGASSMEDRHKALLHYPDPRFVLGPIY